MLVWRHINILRFIHFLFFIIFLVWLLVICKVVDLLCMTFANRLLNDIGWVMIVIANCLHSFMFHTLLSKLRLIVWAWCDSIATGHHLWCAKVRRSHLSLTTRFLTLLLSTFQMGQFQIFDIIRRCALIWLRHIKKFVRSITTVPRRHVAVSFRSHCWMGENTAISGQCQFSII